MTKKQNENSDLLGWKEAVQIAYQSFGSYYKDTNIPPRMLEELVHTMKPGKKKHVVFIAYNLADESALYVFIVEIDSVTREVTIQKALPVSEFPSWEELEHDSNEFICTD